MTNEIYWAIARSTGATALILLSLSLALGILTRSGKTYIGIPRITTTSLHRTSSLLALIFTLIHIVALYLDTYTGLTLTHYIIPFTTPDKALAYGLGTLAFDLMLAIAVTGLLRHRLPEKLFHLIHWGAYACWPAALAHGLSSGSDTGQTWFLLLTLASITLVAATAVYRLLPAFTRTSSAPAPAPYTNH
ncbi:ferric reductase-like transmembrane domain-containing protein [Rothia nasimurium]|uniref:ferric reductase-like transmembrane domain-containing protein n=1 Tax=Rothia nasimurium TaxID=85336 RepID=UPI003BA1EA75